MPHIRQNDRLLSARTGRPVLNQGVRFCAAKPGGQHQPSKLCQLKIRMLDKSG